MKKSKPPLASLSREDYEKRLKKIILAGLGKAWMFWPVRSEVKRRCKDPTKPGWFICELCHTSHEKIDIDHVIPCVSIFDGWVSWDEYIKRRFVFDPKELQGICRSCHKLKSKMENKARKWVKNGN
jgi:5-methylcytosine-specific restriction endonuclease McrA